MELYVWRAITSSTKSEIFISHARCPARNASWSLSGSTKILGLHLMCFGPAINTPSPILAGIGDGVEYSAKHLVA